MIFETATLIGSPWELDTSITSVYRNRETERLTNRPPTDTQTPSYHLLTNVEYTCNAVALLLVVNHWKHQMQPAVASRRVMR